MRRRPCWTQGRPQGTDSASLQRSVVAPARPTVRRTVWVHVAVGCQPQTDKSTCATLFRRLPSVGPFPRQDVSGCRQRYSDRSSHQKEQGEPVEYARKDSTELGAGI